MEELAQRLSAFNMGQRREYEIAQQLKREASRENKTHT